MSDKNNLYSNVYGLTGGIASGKSTVARILSEMGYPILDADQIARSLSQEGGRAAPLILREFKTLDRSALRKIAFENETARKKLESILHPLIRGESENRIREIRKNAPATPIFYEAALLVESGRTGDFDGTIVVTAPLEDRIRRLIARDGIDRTMADSILKSQLSDQERCKMATHRVENTGTENDLRIAVKKLADQITSR